MEKYCLITNDVETTSILNHKLSDKTAEKVLKDGLPALLELYDKFNIRATFFFTGYIAKLLPEVVKLIDTNKHEIASHGYTHQVDKAFDVISYSKQVEYLDKSKKILEDISGTEVISFRAPAARVNWDTAKALADTGFKIDSSVASQRFDMFFSFGGIKKLNWLLAPRKPYFTDSNNLWRKGEGPIFEIPISALIIPYIGTALRITPTLTRILRSMLDIETRLNSRPLVFLTHPNEFIDEELEDGIVLRRSNNPITYLLGDVIRHYLKLKNLGKKGLPIYERELEALTKSNYKFITCKDYYQNHIGK